MRSISWFPLRLSSCILLLWSDTSIFQVQAFAASKRKANKPSKKKGGGFGSVAAAPRSKKKKQGPSYLPDSSQVTKELESFLVEGHECEGVGAEDGTEIGYQADNMRGLFACDTFQSGEFLLGIPFPACLTLARNDIALGEPSDADLGLRLLRLMSDDESDFGPYFASLPTINKNFDATPDFWTDEQLEAVECLDLVETTKERQKCIQDLAQSETVDAQQLKFATWLVKSRGFTLLKPVRKESDDSDVEPQGATIMSKTVMMPYVDMINHDSIKANSELVVIETEAEDESFYGVQATRRISKGEEITLCYGTGQESTLELLANYGFIPKGDANPNDDARKDNTDWSTSLAEDEAALETMGDEDSVMRKILEFRIRMKRVSISK